MKKKRLVILSSFYGTYTVSDEKVTLTYENDASIDFLITDNNFDLYYSKITVEQLAQ